MMAGTQQEQIVFWETLTGLVKKGVPFVKALEEVKARLADTAFGGVSAALIEDLCAGTGFSEAMERHKPVFSRGVRGMVRAGEASGQLDEIMGRIVEGLKEGSFSVPGSERRESEAGTPTTTETARLFRAFGRLLSSGVNIMETLEILSEEAAASKLSEAMQAVRRAIMDGYPMSGAMKEFPDLFAERIIGAVGWAERKGKLEDVAFQIADALEAGDVSSLPLPLSEEGEEGTDVLEEDVPPVVKLVNLLIMEAIEEGASDIHLDPTEGGEMLARYRQSGVLHRRQDIPKRMVNAAVSRIKIMAKLDVVERRRPQDGKFGLIVRGERIDLRVSVLPTARGESVVMRIFRPAKLRLDLDSFGFPEEKVATFRELAHLPGGIVIVCGPAGSGKSTLLYSMTNEIDRDALCVVSVEDPVEYHLEGVRQVQVNTKVGLTYAAALRSVMRQDPDVVVIGEMQDLETAQLAVRAAVTGHLVLVCMHAPTATAAVKLLLDLGLEPYQVNTSLAAAISQRLIRKLCPECRRRIEPSIDSMPQEAVDFVHEKEATVYGPVGCDSCAGGYRGRDAIHEILVPPATMHKGFREALARAADETEIRKAAVRAGMTTLFKDGLEKAAAGVTSVEEVCRVAWGAR